MNDWSKVHMALDDPKWDFRTVTGIVKDTGLDRERVECLLDQHRRRYARPYPGTDESSSP